MRCDYCGVRFATDDLHYTKHRGLSVQRQKIKNKYTKRKKKSQGLQRTLRGERQTLEERKKQEELPKGSGIGGIIFRSLLGTNFLGPATKKKDKKNVIQYNSRTSFHNRQTKAIEWRANERHMGGIGSDFGLD